jgi:hypothetical protein
MLPFSAFAKFKSEQYCSLNMGPGRPIRNAVLGFRGISLVGLGARTVMDQESSGKGKVAAGIVGTVAAVLLWGFGIEYVLHNYVFVSPPENSVQQVK